MYQQQSFHTSGYRGNQQGHDSYLREDSFRPAQSQGFGSPVVSQYQGATKSFQPTGFVQSAYGQNQNQNQNYMNASAFHTASYRGNQQGHDQYLRADATSPSNMGMGGFQNNSYQNTNFQTGGYQNQQYQSPQSFHTASYHGNQQGHDQYLRADATRPTNMGFGGVSAGFQNQNQFQSGLQSSGMNTGFQNQQYQSPQSFHTASYRGNQEGHDQYLRADATNPSNSIGFSR